MVNIHHFPEGLSLKFRAGEIHKRQRKVMLPGFGGRFLKKTTWRKQKANVIRSKVPESKAFVPIFQRVGAEVLWHSVVFDSFYTSCMSFSLQLNGRTSLQVHPVTLLFWMSHLGFPERQWILLAKVNLCAALPNSFWTCLPAAFDYQFGALANTDNEFMKAYFGLMYATRL